MELLKSEAYELIQWLKEESKKQQEANGFILPKPILMDIEKHPEDFIFTRKDMWIVVEQKDHEPVYLPVFRGKRVQNSVVEI